MSGVPGPPEPPEPPGSSSPLIIRAARLQAASTILASIIHNRPFLATWARQYRDTIPYHEWLAGQAVELARLIEDEL